MGNTGKFSKVKLFLRSLLLFNFGKVTIPSTKLVLWLTEIKKLRFRFRGENWEWRWGRWTDMPHTSMTCNPHRTTKTARVWSNAMKPFMDKQDIQCLSVLTLESLLFKFIWPTRSYSKCFTQNPTKSFPPWFG